MKPFGWFWSRKSPDSNVYFLVKHILRERVLENPCPLKIRMLFGSAKECLEKCKIVRQITKYHYSAFCILLSAFCILHFGPVAFFTLHSLSARYASSRKQTTKKQTRTFELSSSKHSIFIKTFEIFQMKG